MTMDDDIRQAATRVAFAEPGHSDPYATHADLCEAVIREVCSAHRLRGYLVTLRCSGGASVGYLTTAQDLDEARKRVEAHVQSAREVSEVIIEPWDGEPYLVTFLVTGKKEEA